MATYIISFIDSNGNLIESRPMDLWESNRDKTNRRVIAIAQTLYSCLAYQDNESYDALWLVLGNEGLDWVKRLIAEHSWKDCAVTVPYPMAGRTRTAVFTLNAELGAKLAPTEEWFIQDASQAFAKAQ